MRAGEIVGIAGVAGNGQSELIEVITGLHKAKSGAVQLNGQTITNAAAGTTEHTLQESNKDYAREIKKTIKPLT